MFKKKITTDFWIPQEKVETFLHLGNLTTQKATLVAKYHLWHFLYSILPELTILAKGAGGAGNAIICNDDIVHPYVRVTRYAPRFSFKRNKGHEEKDCKAK